MHGNELRCCSGTKVPRRDPKIGTNFGVPGLRIFLLVDLETERKLPKHAPTTTAVLAHNRDQLRATLAEDYDYRQHILAQRNDSLHEHRDAMRRMLGRD